MSRFSHIALCATLALSGATLVSSPVLVAAQSKQDIAKAKERFREGKKHYDAEEFAEAAAAFLEAYELSGRNELLYNVGQSYKNAGNLKEAERFLQRYLEEAPDAPNADDVVETIVEIQQQVAAQLATVQVQTPTAGRDVFVDADMEPRCQTPCSVTVAPGKRKFVIRGDDMETVEEVELEPGQTLQMNVQVAPVVRYGYLLLTTDRKAGVVQVGPVEAGLPLQEPLRVEAGEREVTVRSARNATWTGDLKIVEGETTELFVPMDSLVEARRRGSVKKSIAYGLFGVSAAAAVGGTLMGLQARQTYDQLVQQEASRGFVDSSLADQGRNQKVATNLLFGVAAGALLSGAGLYIWDEFGGEKEPQPANPTPTAALERAAAP